jgi:hypothetical protein
MAFVIFFHTGFVILLAAHSSNIAGPVSAPSSNLVNSHNANLHIGAVSHLLAITLKYLTI